MSGSDSRAIQVEELSKTFVIPEREAGLRASLRSLIRRQWKSVKAVDRISFEIGEGEVVGFLGPNGAGKTTTLKMLSGLLYPSSGRGTVLGFTPHRRQRDFLRQITLIMGNRNQLQWDLPAADSFELNRAIYRIPKDDFRQIKDELVELLDLQDLIRKPVRNLSLGERMKVEVAASLLHRPRILFLDEPTLGLDVTMQSRIRSFIAEYNRRHGAAILLTSHYMADVEALCARVIVIHHGVLLYDGPLAGLVDRFAQHKTIGITLGESEISIDGYLETHGEVTELEGNRVELKVPKADTTRVAAKLLADLPVVDLTIEEPPIEDVIQSVFAQEAPQ